MKRIFLFIMLLGFALPIMAQEQTDGDGGMVTKDRFMPTGKRIDREIKKNVFAYKGELALGLTASYGTLTSEDSEILALLENINAAGVLPSFHAPPYECYRQLLSCGI